MDSEKIERMRKGLKRYTRHLPKDFELKPKRGVLKKKTKEIISA